MKAIKKTVKTYNSKDGKRTWQQIRFNSEDNLSDGVVYVLDKAQYEEVTIYQKDLEDKQQQLLNLKEENHQLNHDLEETIEDYERKLHDKDKKLEAQEEGYTNKLRLLENEKTKQETLASERLAQLEELKKANADLTEWKETRINETGRLTAMLEDCQHQLEKQELTCNTKDEEILELKDKLHQLDKDKMSQLASIHNRLVNLSLWQLVRGRHKPIIEEIAPTKETKEVETTINR